MNLHNKVVIVTGASGGLGATVTESFLAAGAIVIGTSRSIKQSDFSSPSFTAFASDLSASEKARALTDRVIAEFGRIDVLAHVLGGFAAGTVADTDDTTWKQMLDVNLTSTFNILRAVIPHMRKSKYGRIVAVGSLTAVEPHAGLAAYVASKTAMTMLVRSVALENADANIKANVVMPGTMDTPANRASMPGADFSKWTPTEHVAQLILTLASDEAHRISNALVPIEGR